VENEVKLGTIIKEIRKEKRIPAKEVAEKLTIDPSTLCKYENNDRKIPAELLPPLAIILGVEVESFFRQNVGVTPT
jgi:transcriptional regulator with XRE-family HTH domain